MNSRICWYFYLFYFLLWFILQRVAAVIIKPDIVYDTSERDANSSKFLMILFLSQVDII